MAKYLIVGAGITGATIARVLSIREPTAKIEVYETKKYVGGACADVEILRDDSGKNDIVPCKNLHGPHIFHTNDAEVYAFFTNYCNALPYCHKVRGLIDGQYVPLPFNFNTISQVFSLDKASHIIKALEKDYKGLTLVVLNDLLRSDRRCITKLASYIKDHMLSWYSMKQWGKPLSELPESTINRVPIRLSKNDNYFLDKYQCLPEKGYSNAIKSILPKNNLILHLDTTLTASSLDYSKYDKVFITAPIDDFFNSYLGNLPYRSLIFKEYLGDHHPNEDAVINYCENYEYTRSTVYENFYSQFYPMQSSAKSTIYEYSIEAKDGDVKYYPVETEDSIKLYNEYARYARKQIPNAVFCGRLGSYKYINMDKAIRMAIDIAKGDD